MENVNQVFMRLTKGYQTPAKSSTIGKMPPKSKAKVIEGLKKLSKHCEALRNEAVNRSEFSSSGEPDLPEAVALLCAMNSGSDYVHGTRRPNIHYRFREGDYDNMEQLNAAARLRVVEHIEVSITTSVTVSSATPRSPPFKADLCSFRTSSAHLDTTYSCQQCVMRYNNIITSTQSINWLERA
jgi:hypothetical protein